MLEDLIIASDRRVAPISVGMIARTREIIDPFVLRDAVIGVLMRHPMARARMRRGLSGRRWWFPHTPDDVLTVTKGDSDDDAWEKFADICSHPFDLTTSPPLRVLHVRLPDGDAVAVAAHHAALDGMSVAMLLWAILERCPTTDPWGGGSEPTGHATSTAAVGVRTLAPPDRSVLPLLPARVRPARVRPVRRFVSGLPVPRMPSRVAPSPGTRSVHAHAEGAHPSQASDDRHSSAYGVYCQVVPIPKSVRTLVEDAPATVNDLLLAAAKVAVQRWNTAAGQATVTLRVRMPISRRTPGGTAAIGNHTGEVLIVTTPRDRRDPATLLAAVRRQTAASKTAGPPPVTGSGIGGVARLPGPARHALLRLGVSMARPLLMPTITVTNLGRLADPSRSGAHGPDITSLHFAAFAGLPQGLVIAAAGYRHDLSLTFCYHRDLFDRAAVSRFAQLYRLALGELTEFPVVETVG
ncbi:hypothetical protein [Candidatus Protofrankia californiensis]|uniref:hypothetical protein n=1 Tax=Candidatus Protofrankia californiensis TaxID=1839754 RepID=UPI0013E9CF75|nr:hypothetical protein [Candidatus Protofrankia californiensis]